MTDVAQRPIMLCILDGWGNGAANDANAIALTPTPHYDRLLENCPVAALSTSAEHVGLPAGQMGNSEVGHQNIGAGRVVMQDLPRIDQAVADKSLAKLQPLLDLIATLQKTGGTCHLMGLLSPGGVHSHQDHIVALARIIASAGVSVAIHGFLDGRDTPPNSGRDFITRMNRDIADIEDARIATISGRYYAMDRDKRWDRVSLAYDMLTLGEGQQAINADTCIAQSYDNGVSDEFVLPTALAEYGGMRDGDGVLMANFRADRAREILTALVDPTFDGFKRKQVTTFATTLGMVSYSAALDQFMPAIFPQESLQNTLGEVVSKFGLKQLRIAETEKYAHVTFFLNGGDETIFDGEERILIQSPKVATYDLQPEMSAHEVTDRLVAEIGGGAYDLIIVNYANPDMVGHTGQMAAAQIAVATIDQCLGRLDEAIGKAGGAMLITADHGNIECLVDPASGNTHTAHTTNQVPVVLVNGQAGNKLDNGRLADVAPTLLTMLGLPIPIEMTGRCLLDTKDGAAGQTETAGHRAQA
jgi:2,3-bisphosphoglycerate-independent phosphoglycerate mutase